MRPGCGLRVAGCGLRVAGCEKSGVRGQEFICKDYVVKPIEFEDFVKAVKDLGSFWAILNEPPLEK